MSKAHTRGPWTVEYFERHQTWDVDHQREPDQPGRAGSGRYSVLESLSEADAHLIAAAPDLLAVCEILIAGRNSGVVGELPSGFDDAINAAVKKAQGRE